MSLKLLTGLKLDDWNNYLKGTLGNLLRALRKDLVKTAGMLTVPKIVEVIYHFYSMMERFLSYYSPEATRFAPKFPRYLFFDVSIDGSLYVIVVTTFRYCIEQGNTSISLANLAYSEFRTLYTRVFSILVERGIHDVPKIHLSVPEDQKKQLTASIKALRGKIMYIAEDSTCSVRPQPKNSFCPQIPGEFHAYKAKMLSAAAARGPIKDDSPAFLPEQGGNPVIDLLTVPTSNNFFLRMVEPPEGNKKQGDTLVHVRCTPHDYDFSMHSRNLQAIRSRQIGASAAASLSIDEYPTSAFLRSKVKSEQQTVEVYIEDEHRGPILVPPQYITDSLFFNEWLDPYDYITSIQEAKISITQLGVGVDQLSSAERSLSKRAAGLAPSKSILSSTAPEVTPSISSANTATPYPVQSGTTTVKSTSSTILAQNVEALLQQIAHAVPGSAPRMQQTAQQAGFAPAAPAQQQGRYFPQRVQGYPQVPGQSMGTQAIGFVGMGMGRRQPMPRSATVPQIMGRGHSHQGAVQGQPVVIRGFETLMGNVIVHGNTLVVAQNSQKTDITTMRYSSQDALKALGLLLAGLPVCEGPKPLFSDILKSRMVGRPRREDFNVQTLMLTAKMRRFLEYGDATSSLLNIYVKFNQNKRSTVTINIQELCASMRGHPIPTILYRRIDPLFTANISVLYYNLKLNNLFTGHMNEAFKLLRSGDAEGSDLYTQSLHNFKVLADGQFASNIKQKQSLLGQQVSIRSRSDDQDTTVRVPLAAVLDTMCKTLVFDPHHSPIAQHACLCFSPQHSELKGQHNSISLDEQTYFSNIPSFNWQAYLTTRNTIVAVWRCQPQIYLTLDACKSVLRQDYTYLQSIHTYLEKKRIINDPSIVVMSTVPPLARVFEDPLQLFIEKEALLRNYNKLNTLYCSECKSHVPTEYYNSGVSRQYPHSRFVCEACHKKILVTRGEKVAANYCKIDISKDADRTRKDRDAAATARASVLSKWSSVEQFVLLNTVRRVIAENRGFFGIFDYVAKQLNRSPEACLQAYLAITGELYEPYETARFSDVCDSYTQKLEQEIASSGEFGAVLQHLKAKFSVSTDTAVYIAMMAKAKIIANVERSRALSELHGALAEA